MDNLINIQPLSPLNYKELTDGARLKDKGQGEFSSMLKDALTELEKTQMEAQQATVDLVTGQADDFHTPIIAMEKANLTLGLAVTVRNKVLDAYHEIMRMQI